MKVKAFLQGLSAGIPIGLGYIAVSFAFGMEAVRAGIDVWLAVLISLVNVTSAGQFASLGIISAGGTLVEMAATQLIINLRYSLMSFSLSQKMEKKAPHAHRFLVAFGVTDEIFGVSAAQAGEVSPYFNYGAMCVAIPCWTLGTLVGAVCSQILPAFVMSALGIVVYGMFLAIIIPPAKKSRPVLFAVLGAMAISCLLTYVPFINQISSGFAIIIATVIAAGVAAVLWPLKEEGGAPDAG
jgi:predicted branched-subunit amino acid permease